MRGEKAMAMLVLMGVFFGLFVSTSASDTHHQRQQQSWWKKSAMFYGSSSSAVNPLSSSIVFPIYGNVYPDGFYYVQLDVGQPPKPYFLDPDTGSDLTWLQCDAPCVRCTKGSHPLYRPSNDLVACRDPLCASLHSSPDYQCDDPRQCDYEVEYEDGGSSLGVLVYDFVFLNLTSGTRVSARPAIGCGYDQIPATSSYPPLDGVLGLGRGNASIVSQLRNQGMVRNIVGHCLSGKGGGFLFFGEGLYDSSRVVWISMSRDYPKHYSAGSAELILGGKATGVKNLLVDFDSGTSYTYLNSQAYQTVISLLRKELTGKLLEAGDDQTLPECWRGKKPFKSINDVRKYFKPLALRFSTGWRARSQFELPPESYLIISPKGNVCLGILNGTQAGLQNHNIIGDISMQGKMVIYDNERQVIGWVSASCDRLPSPNSYFV